jgi:hypothetical protein
MKALADNDADAYSPLIADEFTATDRYHHRPYTNNDRLSQIDKQKVSGTSSSPPELLSAEMLDFGNTPDDGCERATSRSQILFQHAHADKAHGVTMRSGTAWS